MSSILLRFSAKSYKIHESAFYALQTAFEPKVRGAPAIGNFCMKGAKSA
jgi:hypothetical protein